MEEGSGADTTSPVLVQEEFSRDELGDTGLLDIDPFMELLVVEEGALEQQALAAEETTVESALAAARSAVPEIDADKVIGDEATTSGWQINKAYEAALLDQVALSFPPYFFSFIVK